MKKVSLAVLVMALLLALTVSTAFAQGDAKVRFVHVIAGASPIDVYTDGQLTASGLAFGSASSYASLGAGSHQVTVTAAGTTNTIWEQAVTFGSGQSLTLVAGSASQGAFTVYSDDLSPLALGKARLTAVNVAFDAPPVDFILADNGSPVIPGLTAGQPAGTIDAPVATYQFAFVPSGGTADQVLAQLEPLALQTGTSYMVVAYSTGASLEAVVLTAPTAPSANGGQLRLAHAASGSPAIDVLLNDALVGTLSFGEMGDHVAIPSGKYTVTLRPSGADADLLSAPMTIQDSQTSTLVVLSTGSGLTVQLVQDNLQGMTADKARVAVINGLANDKLSVTLPDGTALSSELGFGAQPTAVDVGPGQQALSLLVGANTVSGPVAQLVGGVYYDALVVDDAGSINVILGATSVVQGIASAVSRSAPAVVAVEPTAAPQVVVVEPTIAPVVVEPTAAPVVVEPTVAPVAVVEPTTAPVVVVVQPTAAPQVVVQAVPTLPPSGPFARVFNLDPNRNLQLRQYPDSTALSLGTMPVGTIVNINGRAGAIEDIPFSSTPFPAEEEFVDPASLLGDDEDLLPEETWLNVTYATPDGGSITAWANALYLEVRNPRGDLMKLAELPLVAANLPGEASNTAVSAPTGATNVVSVVVVGLDQGVNLNIRRSAETDGEVLGQVPVGTPLEFQGINSTGEWVFVRATAPDGGEVTGWVNALYVTYALNNRPVSLDELQQRNLLTILADDLRGSSTLGASVAVTVPTAAPIKGAYVAEVALNPGANLNLRLRPSVSEEVLAQIPSGTQLVVTGRSEDGLWMFVTFEGIDGWIAAQTDTAVFVRLLRDGKRVEDFMEVPVYVDEAGATVAGEGTKPATPVGIPTATGGDEFLNLPGIITDTAVGLQGSPGGSSDGLPVVSRGQLVTILLIWETHSYIQLEDGTRGFVPNGAVTKR